jgi:hypothetical protein
VSFYEEVGGGETLLIRQGKWLTAHGYDAFVICPEGPAVPLYRAAGMAVMIIPFEATHFHQLAVTEFQELVDSIVGFIGKRNVKAIETYDQLAFFLTNEVAERLACKAMLRCIHPTMLTTFTPAELSMLHSAGNLHFMNEATVLTTMEALHTSLEAPVVVPIPIAMPHDEFSPRAGDPAQLRMLSVARMNDDKKYMAALITSMKSILPDYPGLKLTLVGDGARKGEWMALASRLRLNAAITFTGALPPDSLAALYDACDVYVGMGTTVLHAASHSRPSVVSFVWCDEPITPGFLHTQKNLGMGERQTGGPEMPWEPILRELLSSAERRQQVARADFDFVMANFHIDANMAQWLSVNDRARVGRFPIPPLPRSTPHPGEFKRFIQRQLIRHKKIYQLQTRVRNDIKRSLGLPVYRFNPDDK